MTITKALREFGARLAEDGVYGNVEIRLPPKGYAALIADLASLRVYDTAMLGASASVRLMTPTGEFTVTPTEPRGAKCPHGLPWAYCTPCEQERSASPKQPS